MREPLSGVQSVATATHRYEPMSTLGSGGMGTIELAWDPVLEREVALKTARHDVPDAVERLEREARLAGSLRHPAIVPVLDAGPGWLVMPLLGPSLTEATGRDGVRAVLQVAEGLAEAHRAGIVHRDVKPANVLFDGDRAVLVDWGLARSEVDVAPPLTTLGASVGTPGYRAPEQLAASPDLGPAADVWALGAVLHEVVTGRPAWVSPSLEHQVASGTLTLPDGPLRAVLQRSLASDPAQRFADAGAFAAALRSAIGPAEAPSRSPGWLAGAVPLAALVGLAVGRALSPAPAAPDAPSAVAQLAWERLAAGRTLEALELAGAADDPGLAAVPPVPSGWEEVAIECGTAQLAYGRLLCVQDGQATVRRLPGLEPVVAFPAGDAALFLGPGAVATRGDFDLALWTDDGDFVPLTAPHAARLTGSVRFLGDRVFVHDGPISTVRIPPPADRGRGAPLAPLLPDPGVLGAFGERTLVYRSGGLGPVWIDGDAVSDADVPARDGAVLRVAPLGHGHAVIWDREGVDLLGPDGEPRLHWAYPDGVVARAVATDGAFLALSTERHGVLVFDASGGLLGQVRAEGAAELTLADGVLYVSDGRLEKLDLGAAEPGGWYGPSPVTAVARTADRGLVTGDSAGWVRAWGTGEAWDLGPNVVRTVAPAGAELFVYSLSTVHGQVWIDGREARRVSHANSRQIVITPDERVALLWNGGAERNGLHENRPRLYRSDVVFSGGAWAHGHTWLAGDDGQIYTSAPTGFDAAFAAPGARGIAATDTGLLVGGDALRHVGLDGAERWRVDEPVGAVLAAGPYCVAAGAPGTVGVWSCDDGALIARLRGHAEQVSGLWAEGATLYTASYDKSVRRWDLGALSRVPGSTPR
ncbi:MAG: protein kinase [Alphaproteobacteria bacterium]|nr:protein kinase [Alphaproteobacteria bacterium]